MSKWSRPVALAADAPKPKISSESAQREVFALLEFYGVDLNDIEQRDARAGLEMCLNKLQKAYMAGKLENKHIDGQFKVVLHCEGERGEIVFGELSGKHKLAMDGFGEKETVAKQHALLGSLCGLGADAIEVLAPKDLSLVECLSAIFFAS